MRGRSSLFWAVLAVLVAGVLFYGPAYLAREATAASGPVDFLARPQEGWRFLFEVVPAIDDARAGSPGAARALATRSFRGSSVQPVRVELLYLPDRVLARAGRKGTRGIEANATLVWKVTGRTRPGGRLRLVGLIDFRTGELVYDVRIA
jgi:hypothetical protein